MNGRNDAGGRLTGIDMTSLTSLQIGQLGKAMDARFAREIEEINAVAARSRDERAQEVLAGRPADHLDAALADIAQASDDAIVRQNVQDVRDIIAARKRIANGTYGTCVDCGEDIAFARLEAYPTAKRCIHCQRLHEEEAALHRTPRAGGSRA